MSRVHGMVQIAKSLLAVLTVYLGVLHLVQRLKRPRILVLAYHRVTPDAEIDRCDYPAMHVSTSSFERQLQALRKLYRVITMSELHDIVAQRRPLREHVAVVTFDDGYRDNYEHAMPILQRQGIPATFFLSLGFVDEQRGFWFDELAARLRAWDASSPRAALDGVPQTVVLAFEADAPFEERLRRAVTCMKALPDEARRAAMRALSNALPAASDHAAAASLRWAEVLEMRQSGMHIGAHGVSHAILTRMSHDDARHEMRQSIERVGTQIGADVEVFAYPNGDADAHVAQLAGEAGARLAFTMESRENRPTDHPLRLGRRNMCEDTSRSAFARFSRAYFWCEITGVFDFVLRRRARQGNASA